MDRDQKIATMMSVMVGSGGASNGRAETYHAVLKAAISAVDSHWPSAETPTKQVPIVWARPLRDMEGNTSLQLSYKRDAWEPLPESWMYDGKPFPLGRMSE